MSELKPCPFCGGNARLIHTSRICGYIECTECKSSTIERPNPIKAWNTRVERTCTIEGYDNGCEYDIDDNYYQVDIPKYILSCGHESYGNVKPSFCPECGARVIEDE